MPAGATVSKLTYEEYLLFPEDGRLHELVDGDHCVTPAPTPRHQFILSNLHVALGRHVIERDLGRVAGAPFDVVLSDVDVVQPDLFYLSHERLDRLRETRLDGAPDLVVEVVSESTRKRDEILKRRLYEQRGAREGSEDGGAAHGSPRDGVGRQSKRGAGRTPPLREPGDGATIVDTRGRPPATFTRRKRRMTMRRTHGGWPILAAGYALFLLPFSLSAQAQPLARGQVVHGTIAEGDPKLADGHLYDVYSFDADPGEIVTITVRSPQFDTYAVLARSSGVITEELATDDDGAGGTDSRVVHTLDAGGSYLVIVRGLSAEARGPYTVELGAIVRVPPTISTIRVGDIRVSELGEGDDQTKEIEELREKIEAAHPRGNPDDPAVIFQGGAFAAAGHFED